MSSEGWRRVRREDEATGAMASRQVDGVSRRKEIDEGRTRRGDHYWPGASRVI